MKKKGLLLKNRWGKISTLTLSSLGFCGCAGPHTPMGSVWTLKPIPAMTEALEEPSDPLKTGPKIDITPSRQIVHGPSAIRVTISDPLGDPGRYQLSVRYNGYDVSESFVRQSKLKHSVQARTLVLENPVVRLPATSEHVIEFAYRSSNGSTAYSKYESPLCHAFKPQIISNTGEFRPSRGLLKMIENAALHDGFNPAFLTGLIAQESRFDPNAVSWAKAVGLTQITSSAEKEIAAENANWPRYPDIENMPVDRVKVLIMSGKMNASNEWRLNSRLSMEGGVAFLRIVSDRWSSDYNTRKIRSTFPDPEIAATQLILASYHSGYARVLNELNRYGKDWIKSPELKEARKYVNRIFSYCDHFVANEVNYERAS